MIIANEIGLFWGDYEFTIKVPNNAQLTALQATYGELYKSEKEGITISPNDQALAAKIVAPLVLSAPAGFDGWAEVATTRALFDIGIYLIGEFLRGFELKKKS